MVAEKTSMSKLTSCCFDYKNHNDSDFAKKGRRQPVQIRIIFHVQFALFLIAFTRPLSATTLCLRTRLFYNQN
jgi:hypothetical protein